MVLTEENEHLAMSKTDDTKQEDAVAEAEALFGDFMPGQKDGTDNPMMRAKEMMKPALPKRFYKEVSLGRDGEHWQILLDGRGVKSPAKKPLIVPNKVIAEALAAEWDNQRDVIDPADMPMTRLVNSIIDGVEDARGAILDEIVAYLGNDFICYPATHPERLVERQRDHWQPVLDWAEAPLGGRFVQASGIMAVEQSPVMEETLRGMWQALDIFQLGALHSMMTLTGSALLPFALWHGFLDRERLWDAVMVDEDWNTEMWGEDEEATKRRVFRRMDYDAAALVIESFKV